MFQEYLRELIGLDYSKYEEHISINMNVCSELENSFFEKNQDEEVVIPQDMVDFEEEKYSLFAL